MRKYLSFIVIVVLSGCAGSYSHVPMCTNSYGQTVPCAWDGQQWVQTSSYVDTINQPNIGTWPEGYGSGGYSSAIGIGAIIGAIFGASQTPPPPPSKKLFVCSAMFTRYHNGQTINVPGPLRFGSTFQEAHFQAYEDCFNTKRDWPGTACMITCGD
jgi:hypothetical protein